MPLSPDDIRAKQFATVRFKEGYRLEEVDAFLDEIEAEIARLTSENAELRSQVAQAPVAASRPLSADLSAMAAPASAAVVVASDPTVEMARLLQLAEATAQARVAQAGDEAEAILMRARVDAQRSVEDTAAERAAQERRVEELRLFEREYRTRLRAYLASQLHDLDAAAEPSLPPSSPAPAIGGAAPMSVAPVAPAPPPAVGAAAFAPPTVPGLASPYTQTAPEPPVDGS
ncbi:MAG: DivIVA domain-containing protein [Actinobacteria bacterium]|uniref:Unannotated protein n=1 Tax=freshwater metagenome TaxID=449393 RepID=A0A6J7PJX8_9ZZZZ|nr:DivIVA domain-containing protein [Actinomycetota bacterium]